ncbi:MAG: hypothetical protein M1834_003233 [Cirrosporium novae-zelandiae]|nr:MAG: hypothetical protein M1834_003233 [Cirrosporium novae-zelandiae]
MLPLILLIVGLASLSFAKTVEYNWNIGFVTAAPDGYSRRVIGINGQWPCPQIDVDEGDRVIVHVCNELGNQSTSLHWHGIHQTGSTHMDGASGTSQCPIAPGQSFTYDFLAEKAGTYWYHSHNLGQFPDGLWGPLIVHDPNPPFYFDEEITLTLFDWYHEEMPYLINTYESQSGIAADGTPTPSGGALMNAGKNISIYVKPNKTYFIHVVCPGNYPGHAWFFDQHPQTTVEIDGVYTQPTQVNNGSMQVRIAPGQRQGVLIHTKNDTSTNYAIFDTMDVNMLFINKGMSPPSNYNTNVTGWLVYNDSAPLPPPPILYSLDNSDFYDDLDYIPLDEEPILEPVDHQIILDTNSANISGISRFTVNNVTFLGQQVPSLYSALSLGENYSTNPLIYGQVNPLVVKHNDIVEIVINNLNTNLHPWHLHGHQFQVLERTAPKTGSWPGYYSNHSQTPARRDTIMLQDEAWAVIRFRADNPGFWALHCHIEFHVMSGFMATIIEAPELLNITLPEDHINACKTYPMKYEGNAAGNVEEPLNLTGAVTEVPTVEWGYVLTDDFQV